MSQGPHPCPRQSRSMIGTIPAACFRPCGYCSSTSTLPSRASATDPTRPEVSSASARDMRASYPADAGRWRNRRDTAYHPDFQGRRRMPTRGFTLKELTVILVLLALAAAAAAPAVEAARERDRRIVCANNLRIIWEGLRRYSNDNHGHYPRTRYDPQTADRPVAFTNPRAADPFADDGPKPNDVTAALYLVVRTQGVQPHAFICPGATGGSAIQFARAAQPPGGEIDPLGAAIQGAAGSQQVLQRLQQEQQQL